MTELRKTYIADETSGTTMSVNDSGHGNVVQHSHIDSSYMHMDLAATGGTTYNIILVDLSDTTSWPHQNTGYLHLESLLIDVDCDVNASYTVAIGFIENVDATSGDLYEIFHASGTKTTGQNKTIRMDGHPNGPKLRSQSIVTSDITVGDTTYQTDVALATLLNPSTADTFPGSGDLVMRITSTGGANTDFNVELTGSYHSHA